LKVAVQLSSILVVFALLLVSVEGLYKSRMRYFSSPRSSTVHTRIRLSGGKGIAAMLFCMLIVCVAFVVPVIQLSIWVVEMMKDGELSSYKVQFFRTLFLGVTAAIITCLGALLLSYVKRQSPSKKNMFLCKLSTIGYAIPGTVLAVGIFLPTVWFDNSLSFLMNWAFDIEIGPVLQGTIFVMLTAYAVRFMAAAFGGVDSSMQSITPSLDEAASISGVKGFSLIRRIHLPLLKKGLLTALILVMVDVVKEMPITLMTRPFGWDTLAVKIYELTSEGEWERAALPGLYLVLVSIIPVVLLIKQTEK
jgi:iron(III) transport system permease protein